MEKLRAQHRHLFERKYRLTAVIEDMRGWNDAWYYRAEYFTMQNLPRLFSFRSMRMYRLFDRVHTVFIDTNHYLQGNPSRSKLFETTQEHNKDLARNKEIYAYNFTDSQRPDIYARLFIYEKTLDDTHDAYRIVEYCFITHLMFKSGDERTHALYRRYGLNHWTAL